MKMRSQDETRISTAASIDWFDGNILSRRFLRRCTLFLLQIPVLLQGLRTSPHSISIRKNQTGRKESSLYDSNKIKGCSSRCHMPILPSSKNVSHCAFVVLPLPNKQQLFDKYICLCLLA